MSQQHNSTAAVFWGVNSHTIFDSWSRQRRVNVRDDSYTHLRLNGGKIRITDDLLEDFYDALAADVRSGRQPNFVVEMKLPDPAPNRCIIDFDAENPEGEIPDNEWHILYGALRRVVFNVRNDARLRRRLRPPQVFGPKRMYVLRADTKRRVKDGRQLIKTGRHIVLPDLYMTTDTALRLRELVMKTIRDQQTFAYCPLLQQTRLEEIYDVSVIEKNGLYHQELRISSANGAPQESGCRINTRPTPAAAAIAVALPSSARRIASG